MVPLHPFAYLPETFENCVRIILGNSDSGTPDR